MKDVLLILGVIIIAGLLGFIVGTKSYMFEEEKPIPHELIEWTDNTSYKHAIWIPEEGCTYYGEYIENVVGTNKYVVYRKNAHLKLYAPTKVIVVEVK